MGFGGAGGYVEMNVYKPLMIFNITPFRHDRNRWLHQLPQVPGRGHQAQSEEDQRIR